MKDNRLLEMRVFRAVAEAGGFTAAAHQLGVSQPFVSETVTALERRLGVKLLRHSTRAQRLTDEGEGFLASCRRVLDDTDQAELAVRSSEPAGELGLTAPRAFGADQIVPRLPGFMQAHPRVAVQLSLSDSLANLLEDNLDVAVRMGRLWSREHCASCSASSLPRRATSSGMAHRACRPSWRSTSACSDRGSMCI